MAKQRTARLTTLPTCNYCKLEGGYHKPQLAKYDAPTEYGWAYLCFYHYRIYAIGQGTKLELENGLESGAVEQEIVLARQRLTKEGA